MKVYGKVHEVLRKERMISIVINSHLEYFHMTNRNMKDFRIYLFKKPYVFIEVNDTYEVHSYHKCREIDHFIKIVLPTRKGSEIYYDISVIQDGVKELINRPQNRLFLDLEFSMGSPLYRGGNEILQYGLVLEDEQGNVILEKSDLVQPFNPTKHYRFGSFQAHQLCKQECARAFQRRTKRRRKRFDLPY